MLNTQRAYEQALDSGDKMPFLNAYQELRDFRSSNAVTTRPISPV
jgi:hypothetical protein